MTGVTDMVELELGQVKQDIKDVRQQLQSAAGEKEGNLMKLWTALEQQKAALEQQKLLLMQQQAGAASARATGEPKTLFVMDPPGTYGYFIDTTFLTEVVVHDKEDYKDFLRGAGVPGLRMVAENQDTFFKVAEDKLFEDFEQGPLVRDFEALVDAGVYLYGGVTKSMLGAMRAELTQRREDEFEQALERVVRNQDPGQDFVNHPELRTCLPHPSQRPCGEVDSVILGHSKAFIGSHKTHINSTKPVLEVADHCNWLTQQSNDISAALPEKVGGRKLFAAVMGEKMKPSLREPMAKVCKERGVLQLRRNGSCISPVQSHYMPLRLWM